MINKVYITDKKQFNCYKKNFWKTNEHNECYVKNPTSFPCIVIEEIVEFDAFKSETKVEMFIYPEEFKT